MTLGNLYPAGVTGTEAIFNPPETEDLCARCLADADGESRVPDGQFDLGDEWLCADCYSAATASDCCGATVLGDSAGCICSDCKEHCEVQG